MNKGWLQSSIGVIVLSIFILAGCAEERSDRSYVQANAIPKSIFTGEWYYRWTIVEVPYTTALAFEGYQGEMERIRWEITEDHLIAYRSYDFIPGSQSESEPEPEHDTAPIAAFPIDSHFDIQRRYNATTGEEYNVFEENTTDRPWNERKYMRVDWFQNDVDYEVLGAADGIDWIDTTQIDNPEHPLFTENYIHFVNRAWFKPIIDDLYNCYFSFESTSCGAAELKVRHSFRKVSQSDYQPMNYPDNITLTYNSMDNSGNIIERPFYDRYDSSLGNYRPCDPAVDGIGQCSNIIFPLFETFGFFRNERATYDPKKGLTETGKQFYINRWNIWQKSLDDNGKEIPYSNRAVKPIVYYLNVGTPRYAVDMAKDMAGEWNKSFQETISFLSGINRTEDVFTVKENSCSIANVQTYLQKHPEYSELFKKIVSGNITQANVTNACATLEYISLADDKEPFTWQQLGDLRYSMINWVDTPQLAGPLGYGPSSPDPVTGEIINGVANIYGADLETYAASSVDIIRAINGDLSMPDLATGEDVWRYIKDNATKRNYLISATPSKTFMDKFEKRFAANGINEEVLKGAKTGNPLEGQERLKSIKGSKLEREYLINDDTLLAFGGNPQWKSGEPVTDAMLDKASPSRWAGSESRDNYKAKMNRLLNDHHGCIYLKEFADDSVLGLALELKDKSYDEIYNTIVKAIYKGVTLHEVGHTLGLRHNFEASYDSFNYFDDYWQLKKIKKEALTALVATPAYQQMTIDEKAKAETETKKEALEQMLLKKLRQYQYSSIMDYGAKFNSDIQGLGKYDYAAIKFGYGRIVETFDERLTVPSSSDWENIQFMYNYENIPESLKFNSGELKDNCGNTVSPTMSGTEAQDYLSSKLNNQEINVANVSSYDLLKMRKNVSLDDYLSELSSLYKARMEAWNSEKNGEPYNYSCSGNKTKKISFGIANEWVTRARNRIVPYRFCSDEYNDSYPQCKTWDEGASVTEIVANAIDSYRNYYFFNNFKRDRLTFAIGGLDDYMNRIYTRYFTTLTNAFQYTYLYRFYIFGGAADDIIRDAYDFYADLSKASCEGINLFAEVLASPEPIRHCYYAQDAVYYPEDFFSDPDSFCNSDPQHPAVNIPEGTGRYYYLDWTNQYYYKIKQIGSMYDKLLAIQAITDSSSPFVRVDVSSDLGFFNINFYRIFKPELLSFFHGLMSERYDLMGGRLKNGTYYPKMLCDYNAKELGESMVEEDTNALVIYPSTSYTINYYAMLFGLAFMTSTQDRTLDFGKYMKLSVKGSLDDIDWSGISQENVIEFTEPTSGQTYRAAQTNDGLSISAAMLQEVKDYYQQYWLPDKIAYDSAKSDYDSLMNNNVQGLTDDGKNYASSVCGIKIPGNEGTGGEAKTCEEGLICSSTAWGFVCMNAGQVPDNAPVCDINDECTSDYIPVHTQNELSQPICVCLVPCLPEEGGDAGTEEPEELTQEQIDTLKECFAERLNTAENNMFTREMYFQRRVERLDAMRMFSRSFEFGIEN